MVTVKSGVPGVSVCTPCVNSKCPRADVSAPTATFNVVSCELAIVIAGKNPPAAPLSSIEIEKVVPLKAVVGTAITSVTSDLAGIDMPVMLPVVDEYVSVPVATCDVPAPSCSLRFPAAAATSWRLWPKT